MAVADKVTVELELRDQQYNARLKSSEREFKRSMDATERAAEAAARDIERSMGRVPESLRRQYRELGTDIGVSLRNASRIAGVAFGAITAYSINAARKAEDINDAFKFTFNEIGNDADKAAERIATSFNRTTVQVKEGLNNAYQILTGVGVSAADSFVGAQQLVERSIDLASQKGISDARAYEAIISGLTGETEPLKRLGVVLNEAAVKAELVRLGFKGNAEQATEAQKQVARLNLILAKTSTAQGDVARTADSANNKLKEAKTEFENAAVALGNELLPAFVAVTGAATDTLRAFNDLPSGVQVAGLSFLGLIAAGGPIAGLLANLGRVITLARETRTALAVLGGGSALAGLGTAGGIGLAVGGVLALGGDTPNTPLRGQERVNAQLREEARVRGEIARLTRDGNTAEAARQRTYLGQVERRRQLEQSFNPASLRSGLADIAGTSASTGVLGGFTLDGLSNGAGSGGGSGRGGGSAAAGISQAAKDLNDLRRELASLEDDLLTDTQRAAKELAEKLATIKAAVDAGLRTPGQAERLVAGAYGQDLKAPEITELDSLDSQGVRDLGQAMAEGFAAERQVFLDQGAVAARGFLDIVAADNPGEALGQAFREAAFDNLEQALSGLFSSLFSQNAAGGGGIGASIAGFFGFGGGRASGGPVRRGFSYDVGESGREKFVAPANGFIMPNMGAMAKSAGPQNITVRQSFDLTGVTGDAQIYGNVQRMIAQGQRQTLAIVQTNAPGVQREQRLLRE